MRISILGCGWLGFPLALYLLNEGFEVKGSTTSKDKLSLLKQGGIDAFQLSIPNDLDNKTTADFWDTDILFLNIPPGRNSKNVEKDYPELIKKIVEKAKSTSIPSIHFASSTSVYSDLGGITKEEDMVEGSASRSTGEALIEAESWVQSSGLDYVIYRFGGLYGSDRHPVKYLAGKTDLKDPKKPVNLVHQADCINVIHLAIKQSIKNEVYNVVSDGHPPRKTFYQSAAERFELEIPQFVKDSSAKDYRVVSNEKLKRDLGYKFNYPNPLDHTP